MPTFYDGQRGTGQGVDHPPSQGEELLVAIPHHHGNGHLQLGQARPQGRHLPGADAPHDGGERLGMVATLVFAGEASHLGGILGEQRLGAPALDELGEGDRLEILRQLPVRGSSPGALGGILDPGGARHEHQPGDPLGRREGDVQGDAPAKGVTAQHEPLGRPGEDALHTSLEGDGRVEVGRPAVAGKVECQRPIPFGVEDGHHPVPGSVGSTEAVQQDQALGHKKHPMTTATDTYILLRAFVDELVRCGMRAACTSPGSRSAPLALSLAREERLRCYSHVDERCAGFFALGHAKVTGLPVAVTCTSGTAAAELLPAAIEAREARVPLLLLTADRPPELRENGAGQAIDQLKLYGRAVKWFFEVGTHEASPERMRWMRTLACRAYFTCLEGRPGAVHLNFPLREPLVCEEPLPEDSSGRPDGRPYVSRRLAAPTLPLGDADSPPAGMDLHALVVAARRGVLVAGRHERSTPLGEACAAFAQAAGWPLLADPLSGARRGSAAVAHYDALLRDETFAASLRPDLVLRVGDLPVSKPLRSWLAGLDGVPQVALDPEGAWQDPDSVLSGSVVVEPVSALTQLTEEVGAGEEDWLASWRSADELASEAMVGVLGEAGLSEPTVASELGVLLPGEATLFVASSMPVRDIETFWPARQDPPRVLCNRGANGIDGIVSSAFGAAAAGDGPVVLLIGDVALAHDLGGLLTTGRLGLKLTIVLLNNEGGGIFDFLPVSQAQMARAAEPHSSGGDIYTHHITTPTGLDFAKAADLYSLDHERVSDVRGFRVALERSLALETSSIVEICTERSENVTLHRQVRDAVSRAVRDAQ